VQKGRPGKGKVEKGKGSQTRIRAGGLVTKRRRLAESQVNTRIPWQTK